MKIRKLRSIICLCLVFALLSPTFTFAISDDASDVAEKTIFENAADMRGNGSRSTTYTARIMQGNTNEENDCRAAENGLLDSGSYTTTSIVETGWTYNDRNSSSMDQIRANATNFLYSKLYDFAYYSGHGGRTGGIATLNTVPRDPSSASGTYSQFNVAETLGVNSSTWRADSEWTSTDKLRVLMLAACFQLDSSIMHYYARAMRASSVRAIAGYHERGPGHPTDVTIAENFFTYANAGNSVKYSWQYGNTVANTIHPWAVLVYTHNSNEYYRIPGFPGNTYSTPSSNAAVYRFRSGLTGSEVVSYSKAAKSDAVPLYITVSEPVTRAGIGVAFENRESISATADLVVDTATADALVKQALGSDRFSDLVCVQTPVYRDAVDIETGGAVDGSETVVERVYHYFNTYNGIRISDASIVVGVDANGIYAVENYWKEASGGNTAEYARVISRRELISETAALASLSSAEHNDFNLLRSSLVYAPIEENSSTYKLAYELISTDGRITYVDAANGAVVNYDY